MKKNLFGLAACIAGALLVLSCSTHRRDVSADESGEKGTALGELTVDRCYVYLEGENYKEKSGGDLDYKDGAFGKKCLGMRWGEKETDFVDYDISLESPLESAVVVMRVAIEGSRPQFYQILLDDRIVQYAEFQPTGGYGYLKKEWKCYSVPLGRIEKGRHILKLRPSRNGGIVNIDCLAIGRAK